MGIPVQTLVAIMHPSLEGGCKVPSHCVTLANPAVKWVIAPYKHC